MEVEIKDPYLIRNFDITYLKDLVCASCLSSGRTLFPVADHEPLLKFLPVTFDLTLDKLCWECNAVLKKINIFINSTASAQKYLKECLRLGGDIHSFSKLTVNNVVQDFICEPATESVDEERVNDKHIPEADLIEVDNNMDNIFEIKPLSSVKKVFPIRVFTKPDIKESRPETEEEGVRRKKKSNVTSLDSDSNVKKGQLNPDLRQIKELGMQGQITNVEIKPPGLMSSTVITIDDEQDEMPLEVELPPQDQLLRNKNKSPVIIRKINKKNVKILKLTTLDAQGKRQRGFLKAGDCIKLSKTAPDTTLMNKIEVKNDVFKKQKCPPNSAEKIKTLKKVQLSKSQLKDLPYIQKILPVPSSKVNLPNLPEVNSETDPLLITDADLEKQALLQNQDHMPIIYNNIKVFLDP